MTACTCDAAIFPGVCERHQCFKTAHWAKLCRENEKYFQLWESGGGPRLRRDRDMPVCEMSFVEAEQAWYCIRCRRRWAGSAPPSHLRCNALAAEQQQNQERLMAQSRPVGGCGGCGSSFPSPVLIAHKPKFLARVLNFSKTMVDFAASGFQLSEKELEIQRQAKCDACKTFRDGDWCLGCGCYLPAKRKIAVAHCPIGVWPGDERDWIPNVHDDWLKKVTVVIPTLGKGEWVNDCLEDVKSEKVVCRTVEGPGSWLEKSNFGMKVAIEEDKADFIVLLNDDVRLSKGFFSGLVLAHVQTGADSISACYNIGWQPQLPTHQIQPTHEEYQARPNHRQVGMTDGTCVLFTRRAIEECGYLDGDTFGKHGWGAAGDLQIRMKQKGMSIYVTEAAYCFHLPTVVKLPDGREHVVGGMRTAMEVHGNFAAYYDAGLKEGNQGFLKKYGIHAARNKDALSLTREQGPEITRRNCIYHVYPSGNWKWNLEKLQNSLELFNGRRVACVVSGVDRDAMREAMDWMEDHEFAIIVKPNNPELCDSVAFLDMLRMVQSVDPAEATFFGHTKSASRPHSLKWAEQMYRECLDNPMVFELLRTHPCVGTAYVQAQHQGETKSPWHYAGSFCWYNNQALFTKDWERPVTSRYFCEAYPSLFWSVEEAGHVGKPYSEAEWQ